MNDELRELSKRIARHPKFRWVDGMKTNMGRVVQDPPYMGGTVTYNPRLSDGSKISTGLYLDLDDWPTLGGLVGIITRGVYLRNMTLSPKHIAEAALLVLDKAMEEE